MVLLLVVLDGSSVRAVEYWVETFAEKRLTVCRVDVAKEKLQLFHRDSSGAPYKSFEAIQSSLVKTGQRLLFGMNAGMYHRDFSPVGLFVAEGIQQREINTEDAPGNFFLKPNGIFFIYQKGAAVLETSAYIAQAPKGVSIATQSGPLLVNDGIIHPAFREGSVNRLIRNGVGVPSAGTALFVISEDPINLHEFASFFRDVLGCPNALFLDGTVSSLFSSELHRSDRRIDLGPIFGIVGAD